MLKERASFGSKIGMILATAGGAVGLGNVWRFPYMVGENGGAAFIIVYIICVLLLGIPCMVSEFIIGRHGAANTYRAYSEVGNGRPWKLVGLLGVMTGVLIIRLSLAGVCSMFMLRLQGNYMVIPRSLRTISSYFQAILFALYFGLLLSY